MIEEKFIPKLQIHNVKEYPLECQEELNIKYRKATLELVKNIIITPKLKIWKDMPIIHV